ncbi:MAG TPA: hypothetical protein VLM19_10400 [Nitrospiraceae bacterium]|nr:hypothetical protein [Nitrospiraceae bacterium]
MAELRLSEPHPCPWYPLIRIGLIAEEVITRHWGPGALAEIVDEMLSTTDVTLTLARLLKGQQYEQSDDQEQRAEPSLLPMHDMRRVILGSVVNLLAHKLPADEEKLAGLLERAHDKFARDLISEGISGAEQAINEYLQCALKQTTAFAKAIQARK